MTTMASSASDVKPARTDCVQPRGHRNEHSVLQLTMCLKAGDRHGSQSSNRSPEIRAIPLGAWGRVLHDDDLAQAILDRVLERGRLLTLDGPSMRTKHLGLDDRTSPEALTPLIRVSGSHQPEFPEPTPRSRRSYALPSVGSPPLLGGTDICRARLLFGTSSMSVSCYTAVPARSLVGTER